MNCALDTCIPLRPNASFPPRSPSDGGHCESDNSNSSSSSRSAGAAVSTAAADVAEAERRRQHHLPHHPHQHHHPAQSTVAANYPARSDITHPQQQQQQQQEISDPTQFSKHLSLSTCGDSASNLTALGTAVPSTRSVTSGSTASTPVSGTSSQQFRQRRHLQHPQQQTQVQQQQQQQEGTHFRSSLDSRSSSHTRDNENEEEEANGPVEDATPYDHEPSASSTRASPAAAVPAHSSAHYFTSRNTPSSKRPRQPQQQQQQQHSAHQHDKAAESSDLVANRAMHIPDPTTFVDSSSTRHNTPMTASNPSPIPDGAGPGNTAAETLRVHDSISYEGEIDRAVRSTTNNNNSTGSNNNVHATQMPMDEEEEEQQRQQSYFSRRHAERAATDAAPVTHAIFSTAHAGGHAVAADATPQEPPPKRFATGIAESMEDLGYMVMGGGHLHTREPSAMDDNASPHVPSQQQQQHVGEETGEVPATTVECEPENEEQRHGSVRRHRRSDRRPGEEAENDEETPFSSSSTSNLRPGERKSSTTSRRAAGTSASSSSQPSHKDKESRRKGRLTNSSGLLGMMSGRFGNDSITASIPYDPTRFNTPPLAQEPTQPQQGNVSAEDSPYAQSCSSAGPKPAATATRCGSETQPRSSCCATPPENTQKAAPATAAAAAPERFLPPPAQPAIQLMETRYAFLAISFMMRMLCKLHKGEPIPSSDFHSHCIPPMSVTMYVQRLVRYCACSGEALLCAFLLLLKYVFHSGHPITIYNAHRLLITSIVLGIKLRDDVYYSNVYYGRIGGISGREMNKLEVLFLSKLDWETQVHEEEYAALLALLQEVAIDVDPTPEQLEKFAAEFPEKAAAYAPDEDDDELEEAAAKLQQGTSANPTTAAAPSMAAASAASSVKLTPEEALRRKTLRGAYRLHQWHTLVEPWMARLQQHVFSRKDANAQIAAAAWEVEGQRWATYYREDEEAAMRQQREASASAWMSPLTVQKRATSGATVNTSGSAAAAAQGGAWATEPPYQSAWPPADTITSHHGNGGSNGNAAASVYAATQQSGDAVPRYSNFINFANVVTGGYFGPTAGQNGISGSGGVAARHASPSSQQQQQQHHYGIGVAPRGGVSSSSGSGGVAVTAPNVRYHTATAERPQRPTSATFDITNRAASTASTAGVSFLADAQYASPNSEANSRHSGRAASQSGQPQPTVAGTTVPLTSPASSTTPGSGINVNAQPYYYVSSRLRRQQQQQQQQQEASPSSTEHSPTRGVGTATTSGRTVVAAAAAAANASSHSGFTVTDTTVNDPCSSSSSFTSPACVNVAARFTASAGNSSAHNSMSGANVVSPGVQSGMEAVLAAMKRGGSAGTATLLEPQTNKVAAVAASETEKDYAFPARPLARVANGGAPVGSGHDGEAGHVPRRSPHSAHTAVAHRRASYASQHSLGKKRSKPDSYKDY